MNESQCDRLLIMLRHRGRDGITPYEALRWMDLYRISAVVNKLKRRGYNIVNIKRDGGYARYVLED